MPGIPAAEVHIDVALVAELIREQFPQYAGRPLQHLASGWDNVIVRLGPDLLVRLPRRKVAVSLIEHEQRWLPVLPRHLSVAVEHHVLKPGREADVSGLQGEEALRLAASLKALHRPAPEEAPANPVRVPRRPSPASPPISNTFSAGRSGYAAAFSLRRPRASFANCSFCSGVAYLKLRA